MTSLDRDDYEDSAMRFIYWLLFRWDKGNAIIKLFLFSVLVLLIDFTVYPGFAALVDAAISAVFGYTLLAVLLVILLLLSLVPFAPTAAGIADRAGVIELSPAQQAVRRVFAFVFSDIPEFLEAVYEALLKSN